MKIEDKMIAEKKVVGKTANGEPVVYVVTHGGLHAFFCKGGDAIETLGMAPHKAIAVFFAEKKAGSIKWKDGFIKNESNELEELKKSNDNLFLRLRKLIFSPVVLSKSTVDESYYIVYDTQRLDIGILHKEEIKEGISTGKINCLNLIRSVSLTEPIQLIEDHKEFK